MPRMSFSGTFIQEGPCRCARDHTEVWDSLQSSVHDPRSHGTAGSLQSLARHSPQEPEGSSMRQQLRTLHISAKRCRLRFAATCRVLPEMYQIPLGGSSHRYQSSGLQRNRLNCEKWKDWPKEMRLITQNNRMGPGPLGLSSKPVLWDPVLNLATQQKNLAHL